VDAAAESLFRALVAGVIDLDETGTLAVAGLSPAGVSVWTVRRNAAGNPQLAQAPLMDWPSLYSDGVRDDDERLRRATGAADGAALVIICPAPEAPEAAWALGVLRASHPDAGVFPGAGPPGRLIRAAIAASPLARMHELVVIRQSRSGKLRLGLHGLFPADARRGDKKPVSIRVEPGGEHGTVFAVLATEAGRPPEIVSVRSLVLTPGPYQLTARLLGPGEITFDGLADDLKDEPRSWDELVGAVPGELPRLEPVHLICALEVSDGQFEERRSRVEQLVSSVAGRGNDRLAVSVICYGAHEVRRGEPDHEPVVLAWEKSSDEAVAALGRARRWHPRPEAYDRAAQLECVLDYLARKLAGSRGRPVLVCVGSRPPFPPRVDMRTGIIPCRRRADWTRSLRQLGQLPGMVFGAIHDRDPQGIWELLGQDAFANGEAADLDEFAAALGLLLPGGQAVPFPFDNREG
jgi:hypothetical protein